MKTLRLIGKLFGISLIILGFNSSCKKDKDDDGEVITCTVDLRQYGLGIETYTFSEDDPETWEFFDEDFDNWNDVNSLKGGNAPFFVLYLNYGRSEEDFFLQTCLFNAQVC